MFGARCILALIVGAVFLALYAPLLAKASGYLADPHFERVRAADDLKITVFHTPRNTEGRTHSHGA
jgi:hypothetical protein